MSLEICILVLLLQKREKLKAQWREATERWRVKNLARVALKNKLWARQHPEIFRQAAKKWKKENRERINARNRVRQLNDPNYRLQHNIRSRVYDALKNSRKCSRTGALLGCSISQLKKYLEDQFRPGMTWENYGPVWHVDHITPCYTFDFNDPEQQRECFNYTNLRPLFAQENLARLRS